MRQGLRSCAFSFALLLLLMFLIPCPALAVEEREPSYEFRLAVNGLDEVRVSPGDVITVTLSLRRTDAEDLGVIYSFQDEIHYDETVLEPISGGTLVNEGTESSVFSLRSGAGAVYLNYLSEEGGTEWAGEMIVGSVRFRVLGSESAYVMRSQNYGVFQADGSGSYSVRSADLRLNIVSAAPRASYLITFDPGHGRSVVQTRIDAGYPVIPPEDPEREGYAFTGWYSDPETLSLYDLTQIPDDDMTLYAGWKAYEKKAEVNYLWFVIPGFTLLVAAVLYFISARHTVRFDTCGGEELPEVRCLHGALLKRPPNPERSGYLFAGWYEEPEEGRRWNLDRDRVMNERTLYAHWLEIQEKDRS